MSFCGPLAAGVPLRTVLFPQRHHLSHAIKQILPFFNDCSPSWPEYKLSARIFQNVGKRRHVLPVQKRIEGSLHIVRICCPLGIQIEHEKRVVSVEKRCALHAFQRVIQSVRTGGAGIDSDADQGLFPFGAQDVPEFIVPTGYIEPFFAVVVLLRKQRL